MEVISLAKRNNFSHKSFVPYFKPVRRNVRRTAARTASAGALPGFRVLFFEAKGKILAAFRTLLSLKRFLWLLIPLFLSAILPHYVTKLLAYSDSFVRPVNLSMENVEFLDRAMNDFAMDRSSYFDSNGNIHSEDGSLSLTNLSFKKAVTFQTYKVRSGDTISGISKKFGLTNISTLIAVNDIGNVRSLRSGQKLTVPSMDGLVHKVSKGESLAGIASKYKVSLEDLLDVNDLSSEQILVGSKLFIPGARLDSNSLQKAMGELFSTPITAKYRLTSKFGRRADPFTGAPSYHSGIDMACPTGTPIKAALSGSVAYTGYSSVFGNYVIIKHCDGYQTLYGHMSKIQCKKGQKVSQGTQIGLVGSTGYSTGPHLHFTVYKNGKQIDPQTVLR